MTHMASQFFATLRRDGTTDAFRDRMLDFGQLNEYLAPRRCWSWARNTKAIERPQDADASPNHCSGDAA
ncbi:hypothetical protein [Halomonas sp. BC04]|uniref:hypothetical protein n=1 Tax=Halomonas sp. BC04 TaxID=1403540 RepID=UPI0003ED6603|nr:hypothetical protein [Halomonas sp. BC04]EWH03616.1 hypothetical protein Q427_02285 [Halomonas sp. BC04]